MPTIEDKIRAGHSLASLVRTSAKTLGTFTVLDLEAELCRLHGHVPNRAYRLVRATLHDFERRGEVKTKVPAARNARGEFSCATYRYLGAPRGRRSYLEIVWHLVRSAKGRTATVAELTRLSGASHYTVEEYLQCLVRHGCLVRIEKGTYRLVDDPGPTPPVNTWKCKKLRALRRKKRGASA